MLEHPEMLISERYRLLKRLRRGGMSDVFLAFDEQAQQQVAIKIVTNSDADCMKRLQREIHILRTLSHAHILPLLGDGISGSFYYLVMPYMQRGSLRDRLAQGKISPEEAGVILHQLSDALGYAHTHGIIHRDIKPSNILLDNEDASYIYLADFGIAKMLEEGSDITQTGFLVGTPEYMAPELAEKPESASSDIYAVGVLLYQMLTGRLPFTGTTPLAICWKHIKEQPAPPSSLNPDISPAIEQVILQAMHKNSRLRFAGMSTLSLAYANALSGIDEMAGLQLVPSIELPVLPPSQVTLRKVERGFAGRLPAGLRSYGAAGAVWRGALSVAALVLLALPLSLGLLVAHHGVQLSQPVAINRAITSGMLAGKVVPPLNRTTPPTGGTHQPQTNLSNHRGPQPPSGGNGDDDHGHHHRHRHKRGDD